jgi:hypothetical protein
LFLIFLLSAGIFSLLFVIVTCPFAPRAANAWALTVRNDEPAHRASPNHPADMEMPARDIRPYRRYLAPIGRALERLRLAAIPFPLNSNQFKALIHALI